MVEYRSIMINGRRAGMNERGASAVEYGLLVAGIAALIVAIVFLLGGQIQSAFSDTCDAVAGGADGGGDCTPAGE